MNQPNMSASRVVEVDEDITQWYPGSAETSGSRPFITIHYAQTLDGRIATRTGDSQWIGGNASLRLAHALRATHDTVMVGVGTVLADNPRLTVRHVAGRSPERVIVDSTLRTPLDANVVADGAAHTVIATTGSAPPSRVAEVRSRGVEVITLGCDDWGHVNLTELLTCLTSRGVGSVLIEGGRALITSALRQRLVDRYVVCVSAKLVGEGIAAVGDLGIQRLNEALTFTAARFMPLEEDLIFDGWLSPVREGVGTESWE